MKITILDQFSGLRSEYERYVTAPNEGVYLRREFLWRRASRYS